MSPKIPQYTKTIPQAPNDHVLVPQGTKRKLKLPTSPNAPRPNSYMLYPKVPHGQIFTTVVVLGGGECKTIWETAVFGAYRFLTKL